MNFYFQLYMYIVYIKEKMFYVEKLVSDPTVMCLDNKIYLNQLCK